MSIRITLMALLIAISTPVLAGKVSPMTISGATTVDTAKAKALFDGGALFVDTRRNADWDAGRIPGAVHLELKSNFTADSLGAEAQKDEAIVCYCNGPSCLRSATCTEKALSWGYTNVHFYRDGFPAWEAAGNPVE